MPGRHEDLAGRVRVGDRYDYYMILRTNPRGHVRDQRPDRGIMVGRWDKLSCERLMIEKYWLDHGGGTLCFEVPLVTRSEGGTQRRLLDGLIIPGGETKIVGHRDVEIAGKEIIIIQAKRGILGMSLMGQAVFSLQLAKKLGPASIKSIALCAATDPVLEALLDPYRPEVSVSVVTKQEVEALRKQKDGSLP